jgi:hypothetical protein
MTNVKLSISDICSALKPVTIGTKVTAPDYFMDVAVMMVSAHDFTKDRVPGQGFIQCPSAVPFVSAGVGKKSPDPARYVCREHRGVVSAYLKREYAEPCSGVALVAYTRDAYFRDPDVTPAEAARIDSESPTHVLVAVLGFAGPESPLPPYRLVWNLAGGNLEAALWSAEEIHAKAKAAIAYDNEWSTVAD